MVECQALSRIERRHIFKYSIFKNTLWKKLFHTIGFKRNFAEYTIEQIFLQLPSRSGYTTCNNTFAGCTHLAVDINKFIPDVGLYHLLSLYQTFKRCIKLYGIISDFIKSQLWNNPTVKFTNQID